MLGSPVRRAQPIGPQGTSRIGRGALNPWASSGVEETAPEVLVHVFLADPEGAADAYGGELSVVDQSIDGHLGDAHHRGHLGHGQELHLGDVVRGHSAPLFLLAGSTASPPQTPRAY